jgi:hypothetical protein
MKIEHECPNYLKKEVGGICQLDGKYVNNQGCRVCCNRPQKPIQPPKQGLDQWVCENQKPKPKGKGKECQNKKKSEWIPSFTKDR